MLKENLNRLSKDEVRFKLASCWLLLLSLSFMLVACSQEESCESDDGYGISAQCLPRYEAIADSGNSDMMFRLYLYWESEGDKVKANKLLVRAAESGSTVARMHSLGNCGDSSPFSASQRQLYASKLAASHESKGLSSALQFYLGLSCDRVVDLEKARLIANSQYLSGDDACVVTSFHIARANREENAVTELLAEKCSADGNRQSLAFQRVQQSRK